MKQLLIPSNFIPGDTKKLSMSIQEQYCVLAMLLNKAGYGCKVFNFNSKYITSHNGNIVKFKQYLIKLGILNEFTRAYKPGSYCKQYNFTLTSFRKMQKVTITKKSTLSKWNNKFNGFFKLCYFRMKQYFRRSVQTVSSIFNERHVLTFDEMNLRKMFNKTNNSAWLGMISLGVPYGDAKDAMSEHNFINAMEVITFKK